MNYQEALKYLDSFIDYEKVTDYSYRSSFNLNRMERLLELFGRPQERIKSIHIAGTKGKGSCAAMVASILREAGFRVGLYTSPHLISPRERIRVLSKSQIPNPKFPTTIHGGSAKKFGGKVGESEIEGAISEEDICRLIEKIMPAVEEVGQDKSLGKVSFFEIYTLLAFLYFLEKEVDFAVLEVGMGGRLDATNVARPLVSVITPISFDHTDKLGDTLESIAKEKAGIIKENSLVVSSPQEEMAYSVIKRVSQEKNARLYEVGKDILFEVIDQDEMGGSFKLWGFFGEYGPLKIPLLGRHQVVNAAAALGAVELLSQHEILISDEQVRGGLAEVVWPGRLQVVGKSPWVILDGAQNRASARALKESIKEIFSYNNLILVLGVSLNKDIRGIALELLPVAREVILTRAQSPRAAEPEAIREVIEGLCEKITVTQSVEEALASAKEKAAKEDLILVAGSLYVVGEALNIVTSGQLAVTGEKLRK